MKKLLFATALLINTSLSFAALPAPSTSSQQLNRIVAIVDQAIITQSELNQATTQLRTRLNNQHIPLPSKHILQQHMLNQLIDQKIILQLAKRAGINISNTQLEQAISHIAQRNNLSVAQLEQKAEKQSGLSQAQFKQQIKKQMLMAQVEQAALAGSIKISTSAVNAALKKYQAQLKNSTTYQLNDILIALPSAPSAAQVTKALAQANAIIADLKAGKSFSGLSRAYSDASNALSGGSLGWKTASELPEVFARELPQMKIGSVIGPIRTGNGFHVIQLEGLHAGQQHTVTRTEVRNMLYQRQLAKKMQSWVQKMRAEAYVKII